MSDLTPGLGKVPVLRDQMKRNQKEVRDGYENQVRESKERRYVFYESILSLAFTFVKSL